MKFKISKRVMGYTLYGLFIFIAFLYLRFPGDVVGDYIISKVSAHLADVVLTVDSVSPCFPLGLKLNNFTLGFRDNEEATLHADILIAKRRLLSFFVGAPSVTISADSYGGEIKGNLKWNRLQSMKGPLDVEMRFDDVSIEKCTYLTDRLGRQISGKLAGSFVYNTNAGKLISGMGSANFILHNGSYQLLENLYGFDKLDFDRVEGQVNIKNGTLTTNKLKLMGKDFRCSLKGNIVFDKIFKNSQIDMICSIEIPAQHNRRFSVFITGTMGNPLTRFL
jgi:type II secretion system protein N